jgi:hypothetical protein
MEILFGSIIAIMGAQLGVLAAIFFKLGGLVEKVKQIEREVFTHG